MDKKKLRWNGWGLYEAPDILGEKADGIWKWLGSYMGRGTLADTPAVPLEDVIPPPIRLSDEQLKLLAGMTSADRVKTDAYERAYHARGRSYHDMLYLRRGRLEHAPDAVVYPDSVEEVVSLVAFANAHGLAPVPYGGGSSAVGGVTPCGAMISRRSSPWMALLDKVLAIDTNTMTAHSGGVTAPRSAPIAG